MNAEQIKPEHEKERLVSEINGFLSGIKNSVEFLKQINEIGISGQALREKYIEAIKSKPRSSFEITPSNEEIIKNLMESLVPYIESSYTGVVDTIDRLLKKLENKLNQQEIKEGIERVKHFPPYTKLSYTEEELSNPENLESSLRTIFNNLAQIEQCLEGVDDVSVLKELKDILEEIKKELEENYSSILQRLLER